jgi:hypothetical protein
VLGRCKYTYEYGETYVFCAARNEPRRRRSTSFCGVPVEAKIAITYAGEQHDGGLLHLQSSGTTNESKLCHSDSF